MPFPLIAAALPYVGYGLMGLSSLLTAGLAIYNQSQQREVYQREEEFVKEQSSDYDQWVKDYERNTGVKIKYPYMGISGQSKYLRNVRIPNFGNLYSMNSANMWSAGARGAIGLGYAGQGAYNKWYNNGYRVSPMKDISNNPEYL